MRKAPPTPLRSLALAARHWALAVALAASAGSALAENPRAAQYYEDALVRFEKKDYAAAVIQLKNAIKIDPKMLPVQVLLGRALLANGEVAAAEVALNEALRLGVNRAEVVVPLAQSMIGQARLQEVISNPRFSPVGLPPGIRAQLLLTLATIHSDLAAPREALKAIEEARAIEPNSADAWLAEVPVRIRSREFKEGLAAVDKALALLPSSADARYLRGSIFHAQGDAASAIADYDKALQLTPTHAEARIARAGLALDQGRLDDTAADVAEARKNWPLDPRAPYLGSVVAERRGDGKAARAGLSDVVGLLDSIRLEFLRYRPQLLVLGGLAHYGLGNYEKARPYLELAVRSQPESPAAKLLGQIYLGGRNHDRAIETLEAYVKAHPADQQGVVLLATAHMAKGRPARAAQLLQDALKLQESPRMRTILGLALVGGGRRLDALAELENAYRKDPSQVVAGAALVDLYLSNKQPAKALQVAETLVKRAPKEAQFHTLLGMARVQMADPVKARAAYEEAIRLDPAFLPAQINLARLEIRGQALEAAGKRLEAILAKDDKNVEALLELSRVAEQRGKSDDALRLMEKATDHSGPKDLKAGLLLVEYHLRNGRPDAASEAVKRLNNRAPDNLSVLLSNASVLLTLKDYANARQFLSRASRTAEFDHEMQARIASQQLLAQDAKGALYSLSKALQAQPNFLPAKALAVDVNLRLGDLAAAEKLAREVLARNPSLAVGHALVGDVAMARGQAPAAVEAYRRAHQIEPSSASLMRLHGALSRQDPAGAAQLAEKWVKANPRDAEVRRMLADGYARAGNFAAARSTYEALVAIAPGDADALNNLANVLLLTKDPGALKVAERALALKPGAAYIIGTAGWAAFQAGSADRALQLLRDARLRDPGNADTRYFLGAVLASKGRTAEAREELQGAVRDGAGSAYAKEADALLKTLK